MEALYKVTLIIIFAMLIIAAINSFRITRKMWLKNKSINPAILVSAFFILIILHFVIDEPWK